MVGRWRTDVGSELDLRADAIAKSELGRSENRKRSRRRCGQEAARAYRHVSPTRTGAGEMCRPLELIREIAL
jgi:hypothetical protein